MSNGIYHVSASGNPPWICQRTACRSYDAWCHQRLASACRMPAREEASFRNDHLGTGVPGPAHGGACFRGRDQEVHPAWCRRYQPPGFSPALKAELRGGLDEDDYRDRSVRRLRRGPRNRTDTRTPAERDGGRATVAVPLRWPYPAALPLLDTWLRRCSAPLSAPRRLSPDRFDDLEAYGVGRGASRACTQATTALNQAVRLVMARLCSRKWSRSVRCTPGNPVRSCNHAETSRPQSLDIEHKPRKEWLA